MEENINNGAIDPRDLDGDGKVTFKEKVQYTADKAVDKAEELVNQVADSAKEVYAGAKEKTVEIAGKVADKSKEIYAEAKDKAEDLMDKAEDLKDKAEDAIDTAKQIYQEKRNERKA